MVLLKPALLKMLQDYETQQGADNASNVDEKVTGGGEQSEEESEDQEEVESEEEKGESQKIRRIRAEAFRTKAESERTKAESEKLRLEIELLKERAKLAQGQTFDSGSSPFPNGNNNSNSNKLSKLPVQKENEDTLSFFLSLEKIADLNEVDQSQLPRVLPSLLNSSSKAHYNRLPLDVCRDYNRTKAELLKASRMTAKFYLDQFRTSYKFGSENYTQFLYRLKDFLRYYLKVSEVSSFEDLQELMLIEQFKESLSDSVKSFVEARKPKTSAEAALHADTCYESSCQTPVMPTPVMKAAVCPSLQ